MPIEHLNISSTINHIATKLKSFLPCSIFTLPQRFQYIFTIDFFKELKRMFWTFNFYSAVHTTFQGEYIWVIMCHCGFIIIFHLSIDQQTVLGMFIMKDIKLYMTQYQPSHWSIKGALVGLRGNDLICWNKIFNVTNIII